MTVLPITSAPVELDRGFTVEFAFDGASMDVQWSPRVPTGKSGRQLLPAYIAARNGFLARVAAAIGANIAVVDLPAGEVRHG